MQACLIDRQGAGAQTHGLSSDTVAVLDSSVPAARRRELVAEAVRDRQRVFLMTSSGARGVSFPRATRILAAVPRFDLEGSLMELAQLVYRGRGSYRDPDSGERRSGDDCARRLVMLIDDWLPREAWEEDARSWLRRASDLLTLVMLVRGTVRTRIAGDAGLPGRPLAIVPVGPVGSSPMQSSMGKAVRKLVREAQVSLVRTGDGDLAGLLRNAVENTGRLFGGYGLCGVTADRGARSFTDSRTLAELVARVAAPAGPLVLAGDPLAALPESVHCIGPFWLESWRGRVQQERFDFASYAEPVRDAERALRGQLARIREHPALARTLKRAAQEVLEILQRDGEPQRERDNATLKALGASGTWIAVPLDHPAFARRSDPTGERVRSGPQAPDEWLAGLSAAVGRGGATVPVVAAFDDVPFAAGIGADDPVRLDRVFDDRYFMATAELNLLNAVLLASEDNGEAES